ncbi:MAG: hypothetical protein DRN71_05440 [Candidatus Nanohalarchaeota archaeon]|nr:MAG: hypothetical protein DRN71_05440 [Candidatus Nanohaloarchaeota archaeon]
MFDEIIKEIDEKQDDILDNLNLESIKVYSFLKEEYVKGNIQDNSVFQFVFKSFYGMNQAGLSNDQKIRFFELLSEQQESLEYILSELYEIPRKSNKSHSIQFSFTTKLLHTINNSKPIYDSKLAKLINQHVRGSNKNEKILSCLEIYDFLEKLYANMLQDRKLADIISKFRLKFDVDKENISDTKVLDFLMWSLGKLKLKKKEDIE